MSEKLGKKLLREKNVEMKRKKNRKKEIDDWNCQVGDVSEKTQASKQEKWKWRSERAKERYRVVKGKKRENIHLELENEGSEIGEWRGKNIVGRKKKQAKNVQKMAKEWMG